MAYLLLLLLLLLLYLLLLWLSVGEQVTRAFSLSLAALLGEDVYNFGELVRWGQQQW